MFDEYYDVIVVGVGPAGSAAAKICAENGVSVIAFEKRQEIGSPKRCGEGLHHSFVEETDFDLNPKCIMSYVKSVSCHSPDGRSVKIESGSVQGWVVERKLFDKDLANQAANSGAKIFSKSNVTLVKRTDDGVDVHVNFLGSERIVKAKIVIACDGVETKIARMMGLNTKLDLDDVAQGAQFEMANIRVNHERIEIFFGNEIAPGGYAWIFPKGGNTANVGIGMRHLSNDKSRTTMDYLLNFVSTIPNLEKGSIIEYNIGGVPVGGILDNMVADNLIVAGDAAHHVNPIHGGGIIEAATGGMLAGEVAVSAIKNNDVSEKYLSKYNKLWQEKYGGKIKNLEKIRRATEKLSDDEINFIASKLEGDDLLSLSGGKALKKFASIMMRKPRLIRLAKELL